MHFITFKAYILLHGFNNHSGKLYSASLGFSIPGSFALLVMPMFGPH